MSCYIKELNVGRKIWENNLVQAPLAGFSSLPFRLLTWQLGRPGVLATEMISAKALKQGANTQESYLAKSDLEGPILYQLWGNDPESIAYATKVVTERGASAVDLNCGCPVRKVRAAGAGSKLMENPSLIAKLVKAMRENTNLPVSIKIRVGIDGQCFNGVEIAKVAESEGVDWLTVHGRHAKESYGTSCRYEEITRVVESVKIPVVGNGDVKDGNTAKTMFEKTGVAGVMVGRACMGVPWVFEKIKAECSGRKFIPPSLKEIGEILLAHHDLLVDLVGKEKAIRHCRKLGSFYSKSFTGAREFRNKLNFCFDREALADLINEYFTEFGRGIHEDYDFEA